MPGSQGSALPGTTVVPGTTISVECVQCLNLRGVLSEELQSQLSVLNAWISGEYLPGTTVSVECVPCLDLRGVLSQELDFCKKY